MTIFIGNFIGNLLLAMWIASGIMLVFWRD
jgi:hypothetical protein